MKKIEVELLTAGGNNAIIKMPNRKYPAAAVQGDTLKNMLDCVVDIKNMSLETKKEDLIDAVKYLEGMLSTIVNEYDAVTK